MTDYDAIPTSASAIVVTYNGLECVRGLLNELDAALVRGTLQHVVVVDNRSVDGTAEFLECWAKGRSSITLELQEENLGFPRAVNRALELTDAGFVALINPDIREISPALEACLSILQRDPSVGLSGPRLKSSEGIYQVESARGLPGVASLSLRVTGLSRLYHARRRRWLASLDRPVQAAALCGAFLVARRSQLMEWGGLDERLFMYLEDVALCRVVAAAGLRLLCVPETAVHEYGTSRRTLPNGQHRALDRLIGEVPWLLAHDAERVWPCRVITVLVFILGLEYVLFPGRSSRTGADLIRWAVSSKPRFVGWAPANEVPEHAAHP